MLQDQAPQGVFARRIILNSHHANFSNMEQSHLKYGRPSPVLVLNLSVAPKEIPRDRFSVIFPIFVKKRIGVLLREN